PDLRRLHDEHETLLLFRVDPSWMVLAGQQGAWPTGLALNSTRAPAEPVKARMEKTGLDGINSGWDWYGWISGFNSGGAHWNQIPTLTDWLLHANGEQFDVSEARTLWSADVMAIHFKELDLGTFWYWIRGGSQNFRENRIRIETY